MPGGVALIRIDAPLDDPPRVTLGSARVMLLRQDDHWLAVAGIPLAAAPGKIAVTVVRREAMPSSVDLVVRPKQYSVQRLQVTPGMVELSPADLARVNRERPCCKRRSPPSARRCHPRLRLLQPVPGTRSSSYGSRRVFNNQPRSPHTGMDIAAPLGTPVVAPARGRVVLTATISSTATP